MAKRRKRTHSPSPRQQQSAARSRRRFGWQVMIVFALALVVRLAYIAQYRDAPFFSFPIIDSQIYDIMATSFARGDSLWDGAFFWPPLYPWFLGVLYSVLGKTLLGVRIVQAVLGAASCLLLYGIGRRLFGHTAGVVAAIAMALCGTCIYFDGEILVPSLYLFLVLGSVLLLLHAAGAGSRRMAAALWSGAGAALGLAALTRPDILLFLPLAAIWALMVGGGDGAKWRARWSQPALLILGAALVMAPVTVRNYRADQDFVLISSNGGLNFYLGNNPTADETVAIRPGFAWVHLVEEPSRAGIHQPSEASRYFLRKGLTFIREHPGAAFTLYGRKLARFWNSFEIGRNRNVYGTREDSSVLSVLLWRLGPFGFPFGLLAPLACAGLIVAFSRDRLRLLPYLLLASYIVSIVLFFVTSRYRLPVVPILILFAAQYVLWVRERLRSRNLQPIVLSVAVVLLAFVSVNRGFTALDRIYGPEEDRFLGVYHRNHGRVDEAVAAYRRAIDADPGYADVHAELGQLLMEQERFAEALPHLEEAHRICPYASQPRHLLGIGYLGVSRENEAEAMFRSVLELGPDAAANRSLGILLLEQRRLPEAEELLLEARRLKPDDVNTWYRLSECYYLQGEYEKTEEALLGALRLTPGDPGIIKNLEDLRALRRQLEAGGN